jgi:phage terminase small subunit
MSEALTAQEQAFVEENLIDDNATAAALRAGYDPVDIHSIVQTLLFEPRIISAIAVAKAQRDSRIKTTQDTVLHEMSLLARSSIDHYRVTDDGDVVVKPGAPEGAMRAIQSAKHRITSRTNPKTGETTTVHEVEIKLWDKPNPLKLLGRQVGLFPDRVEHTGKDGAAIITEVRSVIVRPTDDSSMEQTRA